MNCRHCKKKLTHTFLDLGFAPPSNSYLTKEQLLKPEKYYPLKVMVCDNCWLVQTEDYAKREEFFSSDYAYFSSTSTSWLAHSRKYCNEMIKLLNLNQESHVIEIASNDGYLLKNFVEADIPCLGIEPTDSTADVAEKIGIPVLREFFGEKLAEQLSSQNKKADLIIGNNVYAHVPDINDFTVGLSKLLKQNGTITLEFPHLMRLLELNQFDTIYHEHYSYLSLSTVSKIFAMAGLRIYDIEELTTHGGSLRIYGCHLSSNIQTSNRVTNLFKIESEKGLQDINTYLSFQSRANRVKNDLLEFLIKQSKNGKKVVAYGAAAKGNTLLNYSGVKPDLLNFVCDAAVAKQNKFMPGNHIPIVKPNLSLLKNVDFVLILPWNISEEITENLHALNQEGVKFVVAVPYLKILNNE